MNSSPEHQNAGKESTGDDLVLTRRLTMTWLGACTTSALSGLAGCGTGSGGSTASGSASSSSSPSSSSSSSNTGTGTVVATGYMVAGTRFILPRQKLQVTSASRNYLFSRMIIGLPDWEVSEPRFLISNVYGVNGYITLPGSSLQIDRMAIEYNGVSYPVSVNGARSYTLASGDSVWTDPIDGLVMIRNGTAWLRSSVFTALNDYRVSSCVATLTRIGETTIVSSTSPAVTVDSVTAVTPADAGWSHPPVVCMVGKGATAFNPFALIIADSLGCGFNDEMADARGNIAHIQIGLDDITGGRMTGLNLANVGANFPAFYANLASGGVLDWLKLQTDKLGNVPFNYAHCQLGVNNLGNSGNLAYYQSEMRKVKDKVTANFGTMPFVQQTMTPAAAIALNDSHWTNEADQQWLRADAGPDPSTRSRFNDWLVSTQNEVIGLDIGTKLGGAVSSKYMVPNFSTILTSAITNANTEYVCWLQDAPEVGTYLVFEPGNSANVDFGALYYCVFSVEGTGPYKITLIGSQSLHVGGAKILKTHAAGSIVKGALTRDGIHPAVYGQRILASAIAAQKAKIVAGVKA